MSRPRIVLLGMMTKIPVAGVVWQTVHYLVGLERLGYETYYVEAHARTPSMLMERPDDDSSARAAAFICGALDRFDHDRRLRSRWRHAEIQHVHAGRQSTTQPSCKRTCQWSRDSIRRVYSYPVG